MKNNFSFFVKLIIAFLFLTFPVWAKFITRNPLIFPPEDNPLDWLMFFAQYLCAIASFGMIFYTAASIKLSRDELNEMKRQWKEEHKPNVSVSYGRIENTAYLRLVNTSIVEVRHLKIKGDFYAGGEKSDYFNMNLLDQFDIDIEPHGVRNIVLHYNIRPIQNDCFFLLQLAYNGEQKEVKVFCNDVYSVGNALVEEKLIDAIRHAK